MIICTIHTIITQHIALDAITQNPSHEAVDVRSVVE